MNRIGVKTWVTTASEQTSSAEQFLQMVAKMRGEGLREKGYAYSSAEEFLLRHGKLFRSSPLTPEEEQAIAETLPLEYKRHQCYYNSQRAALDMTLSYCEGIMTVHGVPIEHAWNSINGKVVDLTAKHLNSNKPILGVIPDDIEYFGVEMPAKRVFKRWQDTMTAGPIIHDYMNRLPLLREEFSDKQDDQPSQKNNKKDETGSSGTGDKG